MCRLLLCINENINKELITRFLFQSINKKNTPGLTNYLDADYHKDGYGFAYWSNDENKWSIYKSDKLFINDINIESIVDSIIKLQPLILIGHLRNKGSCDGNVDINNVHPFLFNNYAFVHNGFINNFSNCKEKILANIDSKFQNEVKGETDTEHIFYLLLTFIDQIHDYYIEDGYTKYQLVYFSFIKLFEFMLNNNIELVGNFIFSNGKFVIVIRYIADNFKKAYIAPSLYFNDYNKSSIISSEPVFK